MLWPPIYHAALSYTTLEKQCTMNVAIYTWCAFNDCRTIANHSFMFGIQSHHTVLIMVHIYHKASETDMCAPWVWHANHALWISWFYCLQFIIITQSCRAVPICDIYELSKRATRAPRLCRVNHAVHDMHTATFMLQAAIYVCHTIMSCRSNYGVYKLKWMLGRVGVTSKISG